MSSHLCVLILFVLSGVFGDSDEVKSVSVLEGDSVSLNTDVQVQKDDQILWTFGPQNTRIAEIFKRDQMNYIFVSNDGRFRDRLQMENQTGSLTIRNIRSEHTGLYELNVISSRKTQKRFNITVYETTKPPQTSYNLISIITVTVVCALLLLLFISVCVCYCCCRKCNREKPEDQESMLEYTEIIYRLQV